LITKAMNCHAQQTGKDSIEGIWKALHFAGWNPRHAMMKM